MDFIFDVASKMVAFPCIVYFIGAISFLSLEYLVNKLFRGGF